MDEKKFDQLATETALIFMLKDADYTFICDTLKKLFSKLYSEGFKEGEKSADLKAAIAYERGFKDGVE
jgi:alkyl hydroperoxide reductase subunit AhpC